MQEESGANSMTGEGPSCRPGGMKTDPAVVRRAQQGNREALENLISAIERPLYVTALAILGKNDDAADAFQEAALSIMLHIGSLREPAYFNTWATRILVNHALTIRRNRSKVLSLSGTVETRMAAREPSHDLGSQVAGRVDLMQAMLALAPHHRAVIALRYLHDVQLDGIAEALDVPVGTVKSRLHYALRRLRAEMAPESRKDGVQS